jgi:hypothetical protein
LRNRWKRALWVALAIVTVVSGSMARRRFWPTPTESLRDFYVHDGAEDMLMDPLILGGEDVVPLVLEQLPNRQMPRRRYAIAFLGNGGFTQALPGLRAMLTDQGESDIFRGDALQAICEIDATEGKRTASQLVREENYLGSTARQIARQGCRRERRTWPQAAAGHHD